MNTLDLAKSIKDGTLDLICPRMELLVCPSYTEVALCGSGIIRSDDLGRLYFRLVAPFTGSLHRVLTRAKLAGEIHEAHDHVMLRAVDETGREWRSNWLLIHLSFPGSLSNWIVRHHVDTLSSSRARPLSDFSSLTMHVPEQGRLMFDMGTTETRRVGDRELGSRWALDHHSRRMADAEFTFQEEEQHWLTVIVEKQSSIMPDWPGLLCHALEFASAQRARAAVITRIFSNREDLGMLSGPFFQYDSLLPAPVHCSSPNEAQNYWNLVESFFSYALKDDAILQDFLDELSGIRDGSRASVQTACLTIAVGIESLANVLLPDPPGPFVDGNSLRSLMTHIESWDGDESIKQRAKGQLQQFKQVRASDRLYAWADAQHISHELVDRWRRIRNPRAHGSVLSEDQKLYDGYFSVVELLYRIVTWIIGYKGPLVETSTRGWGVDSQLR